MKVGVPFDVAWDMANGGADESEILAYIVAGGEIEGGKFDWDRLEWVKD